MDVFASVIRRCPTGIDWSQNKTLLPIDDENWFLGKPQQSCFLELGLVDRWKALQASGNQSPKAWFIIVNSFMKEAQTIPSPIGVNRDSSEQNQMSISCIQPSNEQTDEARSRLATIYNSLRCFKMALPLGLKYRN
jgi:hypothetical protein